MVVTTTAITLRASISIAIGFISDEAYMFWVTNICAAPPTSDNAACITLQRGSLQKRCCRFRNGSGCGSKQCTSACGNSSNMIMRSEEHTSELQSLMRISYAVFCLTKKIQHTTTYA